MPDVIYMPQNNNSTSVGSAGRAIGEIMGAVAQKRRQEAELKQIQAYQDAIKGAKSREDAIDIFTKIPFKTVQQMQMGKEWLDTVHPPRDTTPREVTQYDPETGAEIKKFVPQSELGKVGPTEVPRVEEFYKKDKAGNIRLIGTFPEERRPAGSVTLKELEQMRAERTATRLEKEKREVTPAEDLQQLKTYNAMLGNLLNVQKVVGNEVILDFGGNKDKEKAYKYAIQHSSEFRQKFPGDPNRAAFEALTAGGGFTEPAPEAAPVSAAPSQGGLITSLWNKMTGGETPAAPTTTTSSAPAPKARAPQQAIDYLKKNNTPEIRKAFKEKYGYLPD